MQRLDKQEVIAAYQEASKALGPELWLERVLTALDAALRSKPLIYRGYGPYWWNVKKALREYFINPERCYEGEGEQTTEADFDLGSHHLNLTAAILYESMFSESNFLGTADHLIESPEGDSLEYGLEDPDLEALILVSSLSTLGPSIKRRV